MARKIALIVDFAETVAPAGGDVSSMPADDRNALVILKRWAQNAAFLRADVTICLIAENQIELNQGIVQNPGVASIQIPLPDENERLDFIRAQLATVASAGRLGRCPIPRLPNWARASSACNCIPSFRTPCRISQPLTAGSSLPSRKKGAD